eukprot:5285041-Pleurochrysis_carterae.AAC.1
MRRCTLDAQPDMSDPAFGKAARRAAQQSTQPKEARGSKAHLVRYDDDVVSIGNDKFSTNALHHKLGNDVCLPVAISQAQRLGDLGNVLRAVLESVSIGAPRPGGRGRPTLPHAPPFLRPLTCTSRTNLCQVCRLRSNQLVLLYQRRM